AAEAADLAIGAGAARGAHMRLDLLHHGGAGVDVDPGIGIGQSVLRMAHDAAPPGPIPVGRYWHGSAVPRKAARPAMRPEPPPRAPIGCSLEAGRRQRQMSVRAARGREGFCLTIPNLI